jgi:hypothetical protein
MGEADLLYLPQKNVPEILYPTTEEGSRRVEAQHGSRVITFKMHLPKRKGERGKESA